MSLFPGAAIQTAARRQIGLATENRGQTELPRGVVELHRPVHHAVVGQGDRRCPFLGGSTAKTIDPARPVQERVLGVDV